MDYEKAYNEALERAKNLYAGVHKGCKEVIDNIFPELCESEDERIRQKLVALVQWGSTFHSSGISGQDATEMQKWLEKQKEQKPMEWKPQAESLEALMYAIEGKWDMIKPTSYLSRMLEDLYDGLVNTYNVDDTYLNKLHEAASAGDIEELRALKRKIDESMERDVAEKQDYSSLSDFERALHRGFLCAGVKNIPVSIIKETAKDCLAQIRPAEYTLQSSWSTANNKPAEWNYPYGVNETADRLVSLAECLEMDGDCLFNGYKGKDCGKFLRELARRESENKPAEWSKEDVKRLYSIGTQIGFLKGKYSECQKDIDWLYALAEKMGFHKCKTGEVITEWKKEDIDDKMLSKPKPEWSKEDEKMLQSLILHIGGYTYFAGVDSEKVVTWLKSLRPQSKVELSKDVKKTLDEVSHILIGLNYKQVAKDYKQAIEQLISLRPSWKPSEINPEEVRLLDTTISFLKDFADKGYENAVECIDWLKSKRNGTARK